MPTHFDHERLDVYQEAIRFVALAGSLVESRKVAGSIRSQLDRAAASIPLNIAEGNGKFAMRDRCHFLGIARGSALECAACLDVLVARQTVRPADVEEGKAGLIRIVSMLTALVNSLSKRAREEEPDYLAEQTDFEHEHEQEHEHG